MIRQGSDLPAWIAAALFLLLPLPFGGVTSWAVAAAQVTAFLLLAAAVGMSSSTRAGVTPLERVGGPVRALAALALLGILQSLPWPSWVASVLSPAHTRLFEQAAEMAGLERVWVPLSLAPEVSRSVAMLLLAVAACLVAGALIGRRHRARRLCGMALLLSAVGQLGVGLPAWLNDRSTLWGIEVASAPGRMHGTFVNPNHFAHYLGIVLPCLFAWIWWAARRARNEEKIVRRLLWVIPPLAFWLAIFTGMTFSASRGALLAALVTVVAQGVFLAHHYRRWRLAWVGVGVAGAGLVVGLWLGFRQGLSRLVEINPFDVSMGSRLEAWGATLDLWRKFPVLGSGLGTFRDGFPLVQPRTLGRDWWHAHNDYLELLATAGVVGVLLAAWGAWVLIRRLWRNFAAGERSEDRATALAALGALTACGIHEALDFGLTMPANALTLALVCGLAAGVKVNR